MGEPGGAAFTGGPWYARSADFTGPQAVGTHVSLQDQPCPARSAAFTGYYEAYLVAQDAKARERFLKREGPTCPEASFARWLTRWTLAIFAVAIVVGFLETVILGPKGPKTPRKTSIATQVFGD